MALYTHKQFMKARGKKLLEKKGYVVKNDLIDYTKGKGKKKK